ncbi:helix-turn-helix domain-containing protein [Rhizobium halophytocola]|uniref:AraC-like DNA-binding protein n=1 Tax=Rhizobium halophytocola TaxID=735519 RepID=A0ABS4E544_9HYPH|nr:AraC family transcriptional regulator [Rhizobium halophytocola]MBP1853028.1 AraC-like DNA-binding protein [Rhizobium halophytocola]
MTFQPQMTNRIDGFSVTECFHRRYWNGMVADLWHVDCAPLAGGVYKGMHPRLFIALEAETGGPGGGFRMWCRGSTQVLHDCHRPAVSFIPAGMEMTSELRDIHRLRHLDIHFDAGVLARRLGGQVDAISFSEPRFLLAEERLTNLARLIAAECAAPDPLHNLYGEGLVQSLILAVLGVRSVPARRRSPLAGWQLRRAVEFIEANCLRAVRLEELSALTGLSETHFSHAFKAATGIPPQQWQMNARVERVKVRLTGSDVPLTTLAAEAGYADAAHFSRSFRRHVGMTPSAWRRLHRR